MKCPFCGYLGDKVVDSRESKEGEVIRRCRECLDGGPLTSYERIDEIPYMVIKQPARASASREKLIAGLLKACEKRPVRRRAGSGRRPGRSDPQKRPEKEMGTKEWSGCRGGTQESRQGLRALRFGLPSFSRHRRVHDELKDLPNAKD